MNGTLSQYQAVQAALQSLQNSNPIAQGIYEMIGNWTSEGPGTGTQSEFEVTVTE